jgi:membrane associated rhomboid family serine protease
MARFGSAQFAFPEFSGATRRLILWNLAAFFALLLIGVARQDLSTWLIGHFALRPEMIFAGWLWQPITYSLIHLSLIGTLFELLSLWFLGGLLESIHGGRWLNGLYVVSVLGAAVTAIVMFFIGWKLGYPQPIVTIYGCMGGIFGMLTAIALLHGDLQFQLFFVIGIKAKYLAIIYTLDRDCRDLWRAADLCFCPTGRRAGGDSLRAQSAAPRLWICRERELVRVAQQVLPLEAAARGQQISGLYEEAGPHGALRWPGPAAG